MGHRFDADVPGAQTRRSRPTLISESPPKSCRIPFSIQCLRFVSLDDVCRGAQGSGCASAPTAQKLMTSVLNCTFAVLVRPPRHELVQQNAPYHAQLLAVIAELDYVPPALTQQEVYLGGLETEAKRAAENVKVLEEMTEKERKEQEVLRDSTARRLAAKLTGRQEKFEAKASKEERCGVCTSVYEALTFQRGIRRGAGEGDAG
ncbi:hypothetical protein B0H17DRAFT_307221 [Mycena rosella]|uniref:Uncharacterized protein n=1 Tax=Mycena rosella TaxID=1033263 RepID=A0AAD7DTG4_MYCRO|nr:hypothetical protein B0H17DRAFT_307221 [Mycena rosella]